MNIEYQTIQTGKPEYVWRESAHEYLDFILNGPFKDPDIWAQDALKAFGHIIKCAYPAFDMVANRVLEGRARVIDTDPHIITHDQKLDVFGFCYELDDAEKDFEEWNTPPEVRLRIVAEIIDLLSHNASNPFLWELSKALTSRSHGDWPRLFDPQGMITKSKRYSNTIQRKTEIKMEALQIRTYLVASEQYSATKASAIVGQEFNVKPSTVDKSWKRTVCSRLSRPRVVARLNVARCMGEDRRKPPGRTRKTDMAEREEFQRELDERCGVPALKRLAKDYRKL